MHGDADSLVLPEMGRDTGTVIPGGVAADNLVGPTWTCMPWAIDADLDRGAGLALPTGVADRPATGVQVYAERFLPGGGGGDRGGERDAYTYRSCALGLISGGARSRFDAELAQGAFHCRSGHLDPVVAQQEGKDIAEHEHHHADQETVGDRAVGVLVLQVSHV